MKMIKTLQKTTLTSFLFALLGASSSYALTFTQIKQTLEKGSQKEISLMEENYQKLYTKNFMSSCIKAANIKQAENYCKCSLEGLIEKKVLELRLEKYFENENAIKVRYFFSTSAGQKLVKTCLSFKS